MDSHHFPRAIKRFILTTPVHEDLVLQSQSGRLATGPTTALHHISSTEPLAYIISNLNHCLDLLHFIICHSTPVSFFELPIAIRLQALHSKWKSRRRAGRTKCHLGIRGNLLYKLTI